jgi:GT2 family glycosyltransferase
MKITLAFMVFRPGGRWSEALFSWLFHLSGDHQYEVICTFDDPENRDHPIEAAGRVMSLFPHVTYKPLMTGDINELRANNRALDVAAPDSDVFVVLQDDNFIRDTRWDARLVDAMQQAARDVGKPIGAMGLLAGLKFDRSAQYRRVECWRDNKPDEFRPAAYSDILDPNLPIKVYAVDGVNRPLAVPTPVMHTIGGFDDLFAPRDWDCTDLGVRLMREGYQNLYVPLDIENYCVKRKTQTVQEMAGYFEANKPKFMGRHRHWFNTAFQSTYRPLFDFEVA